MTMWPSPLVRLAGLTLGFAALTMSAQPPGNIDEDKVPPYSLPELLVANDGGKIASGSAWRDRRRPELLELFAREVYGRTPGGRPAAMHWEAGPVDRDALGGRATRKEITVWFTAGPSGPHLRLLVYQPNAAAAPVPVFLGLNFHGNHTVHADPVIALPDGWVPNREQDGLIDHRAVATLRGVEAEQWQVERVIARGYALATIYAGDLCPDHAGGLNDSAATIFGGEPDADRRPPDAWGAVGVWAWGLSRALDVIAADPSLDAHRVAVIGHSRLGKAALWAGAQDERFALVISNESGCGGAALSKRIYGETVADINDRFPHWFARNFRRYNHKEANLPVDQHELLALVAPRPLYVASAEGDRWADPRGEFLAAQLAGAAYALFGAVGVGSGPWPAVGTPQGDVVRYHLRSGPHDITAYDWAQYLDFADRHLRAR
jgi:hypothetical protein